MKKADKDAFLEQFKGLAGLPDDEITGQISAMAPTLKPGEVKELVKALNTPPPPGSDEPTAPAPIDQNSTFEVWNVEPEYIHHPATRGAGAYKELKGFQQINKTGTTRITADRAEMLNGQSESTKVRYYLAK